MSRLDFFTPAMRPVFLFTIYLNTDNNGARLGLSSGCPAASMGWFPQLFSESCQTGKTSWTLLSAQKQQRMVGKAASAALGRRVSLPGRLAIAQARARKPNSAVLVQLQTWGEGRLQLGSGCFQCLDKIFRLFQIFPEMVSYLLTNAVF